MVTFESEIQKGIRVVIEIPYYEINENHFD